MSSIHPVPTDDEAALSLWSLAIQPATRQGPHASSIQQCGATSSNSHDSKERSCNGSQRMFLSDLAPTQLLQLIMRCLWTEENLQFARCSRSLMAAADDPFAWTTSTHMYSHQLSFTRLPRALSFKHARVLFCWLPDGLVGALCGNLDALHSQNVAAMLRATEALGPNFAEFYTDLHISLATWHSLIQSPSFQVVQQLAVSFPEDPPTAETFTLLSKLRSLTSLRLSDHHCPASGEDAWSLLCEIPNLRSLSIVDAQCGPHASRLSFAGRCPQLRKLECTNPRVYGAGMFSKALSALHRIEHLVLSRMWMQGRPEGMQPTTGNGLGQVISTGPPPTAEDMDRAFAAMDALTTLELDSCEGLDALLPSLGHAPSLRRVIIQSSYFSSAPESSLVCCSPEATAVLLAACPRISISIILRNDSLWACLSRVFQDARVLDAARTEGRFETVDKCLRFKLPSMFGAALTATATAPVSPFSSTLNLASTNSATSLLQFSPATAAASSSNALYGIGLGNWSAAGSTSSATSALSFATADSSSSSNPLSNNAGPAAAVGNSQPAAAPAIPPFGGGGLFGSLPGPGFGQSVGPFSLTSGSSFSLAQPSSSSWTGSDNDPAFSISGFGANAGAAAPMFSLRTPDAAPPTAASSHSNTPATAAVSGPADNLDDGEAEDM